MSYINSGLRSALIALAATVVVPSSAARAVPPKGVLRVLHPE